MGRPLLILAHPGHELRLFGWMRRLRPRVAILTDGSGGAEADRTLHSRRLVESLGAEACPVFGLAPDRAWYAALMAADAGPLIAAAAQITGAVAADPPDLIVCDPIEGYNPVHDLMAPLAARVAAALGQGTLATYPLMAAAHAAPAIGTLRLDMPAIAAKRAAIAAYGPLAAESARLLAAHPAALAEEVLLPAPPQDWPASADPMPAYERIGRERVAAGRYAAPLTYAGHVRPVALRLMRAR